MLHTATPQPAGAIARTLFLMVCFLCFLYPVIDAEGRSINYSFAVFPVLAILVSGRVRVPPPMVLHAVAIYTVIFIVASLYQYDLLDLSFWRLASFLLFMTLFLFAFIKIDNEMIVAFKAAIVVISVFFSLVAAAIFLGAEDRLHYEAKNIVGSQRYGFIYMLGFWIALFYQPSTRLGAAAKWAASGLILAGILLTFSRSSIVALLFSVGLFAVAFVMRGLRRGTIAISGVITGCKAVAIAGLLVFLTYYYLPLTFEFYADRLFGMIRSGDLTMNLADPETSEGTRIHIIETAYEFVVAHPLTGSGYLGVWSLPESEAGSAHNQYIDVLLRTGFIGFLVYGLLIFKVLNFLRSYAYDLFWGVVGILVYGLFHETFKESQGAFVLAFLVGMATQIRFAPLSHSAKRERLIATRRIVTFR